MDIKDWILYLLFGESRSLKGAYAEACIDAMSKAQSIRHGGRN